MVILGVTFGATEARRDRTDSSLEVVLVTTPQAERVAPKDAVLLAQTNLIGQGNAAATAALTTTLGIAQPDGAPGPFQPGAAAEIRTGRAPADTAPTVIQARKSSVRRADAGEPELVAAALATAPPMARRTVDLVGRLADDTRIPDQNPRELLVSASTRESRIAGYLTLWKRKVEQTGTLNYPLEAHRTGTGYPVLEVAIAADGSLKAVTVVSSSGQRGLDQAAVQILRLAAPFAPFPDALRSDYDVLRFAYEWRFSAGVGRMQGAGA
jgi:periplasmic protein TonB